MQILHAHREKTQSLKNSMDRMIELHDEMFDTWSEIVSLSEGEDQDRVEKTGDLHARTHALAREIGQLRKETFGHLSDKSALLLSSQVDSTALLFDHEEEKRG